MKPTRAALYARCSTGHQDVGLQVDELRAVADARVIDAYPPPRYVIG